MIRQGATALWAARGRRFALSSRVPIASIRLSVCVCLVVAGGTLAAPKQLPTDAPLRLNVASVQSADLMSEPQLREEITRVEGSQLSKSLFVPGVILGVGGTLAAVMAGIINVDVRSCPGRFGFNINCHGPPHQTNPSPRHCSARRRLGSSLARHG